MEALSNRHCKTFNQLTPFLFPVNNLKCFSQISLVNVFTCLVLKLDPIFNLQPQRPLSRPHLFPFQITDLVTFASLLTLPSPSSPFLFAPVSPCYVSSLCPNLWPLDFEERQRWPLKMASVKFTRTNSHE